MCKMATSYQETGSQCCFAYPSRWPRHYRKGTPSRQAGRSAALRVVGAGHLRKLWVNFFHTVNLIFFRRPTLRKDLPSHTLFNKCALKLKPAASRGKGLFEVDLNTFSLSQTFEFSSDLVHTGPTKFHEVAHFPSAFKSWTWGPLWGPKTQRKFVPRPWKFRQTWFSQLWKNLEKFEMVAFLPP